MIYHEAHEDPETLDALYRIAKLRALRELRGKQAVLNSIIDEGA